MATTPPRAAKPAAAKKKAKVKPLRTRKSGTSQRGTGSSTSSGNPQRDLKRKPLKAKTPVAIDAEETDPLAQEDLADVAARNAPAWLVSLIFHTLLIVALALIYVVRELPQTLSLNATYSDELGKQLEDDVYDSAASDALTIDDPTLALDDYAADDPLATAPDLLPRLDGFLATDDMISPSLGQALTGRERGNKEALLAKYGGTKKTEAAVAMGLAWLARNQRPDGTWSLKGPYGQGSPDENKTSATAMALLAFQGAGHTHEAGKYKKNVLRGWKAMLKMQDKDGNFFHGTVTDQRLYSQAQAMIALCEIYGMTQDPMFAQPAQLAVDYAVDIQAQEGGWRYRPGSDADLSVTGWFVMGLQSAMMAGLEVPSPTLQRVSKYLDAMAMHGGAFYKYHSSRGGFGKAMTAEGLLCRQYLGWPQNDERLHEGAEYLLENPVDWSERDVYYWYYATQVLHHLGQPYWDPWNDVMRKVLPAQQVVSGPEKGSWDKEGDRWGSFGGRLYTTCMSLFMLEVYYRHLPIYSYRSK